MVDKKLITDAVLFELFCREHPKFMIVMEKHNPVYYESTETDYTFLNERFKGITCGIDQVMPKKDLETYVNLLKLKKVKYDEDRQKYA
jgi:hypothetical protein